MYDEQAEVESLWGDLREAGRLIADAPARKVGMPSAAPFSVLVPVEIDGQFVLVDLDPDEARQLAQGLLAVLPEVSKLSTEVESEYRAHTAIQKAQDGTPT